MPTRREATVVKVAAIGQGIALVTFPAASGIFTSSSEYGLTSTAYGAMFVPQAITAVASALLGATWARRVGTRRVYLIGLAANLLAMSLLVVSSLFTSNEPVAYGLLLLATTSLGIGFGFTVPALNTFTAAFNPTKVDTSVLVLNALLGLGTALAPLFVAVFVGLGFWWGLPVLTALLLIGLLVVSAPLPLQTGARQPNETSGNPARARDSLAVLDLRGVRARLRDLRDDERQLGITGHEAPRSVDHDGVVGAHRVLGVRDAGPRRVRGHPTPVPDPTHLPPPPLRPRDRVPRDRGAPERRTIPRRRRVQPGRHRLLGPVALDDQLRPRRARRDVRVGRRRPDRLLPGRLRDRGVRSRSSPGVRHRPLQISTR